MTKTQQGDRLDPATVIRAGLDLLDEKGLDAVTTRAVADRLGVRINTVQWHVKTKARMIELMADAVIGEIPLTDLPADPADRARELARRFRRGLLSHRDGAALVVGTYAAEPGTLRFAEALVEALLKCGLGDREAAWTSWAVVYFALGLTQEEQAVDQRPLGDILARAISGTTHPALHRVAGHLAPGAFEERFEFGVDAILGGR
ncbi:TetR/AcrR family transcriptional regulator C-terminal domain-containing protein [Streptomyces xylophagus]|uniref:TetR/AcrR family transcriptional regulator C-terminal domain-containing protein n=1 Tax=Streptomyces xylophagus TaxID=285514 RepID=UPI0005BBE6BE|nr:TetR/AcrR family transcriptional regulator C-terminal domain-containing protein [Streptomyces xylophagus]